MSSKKQVKEAMVILSGEVNADNVMAKGDGTFELRFGFFYRHGNTSEKCAAKVEKELLYAKVVSHEEVWRAWPKDSYWKVAVAVTDPDGLVEQAQSVVDRLAEMLPTDEYT